MRWASLGRADRALVFEAAAAVALGWIGLRAFRLQTVHRFLTRSLTSGKTNRSLADEAAVIERVQWAVTAVARRVPAATCLVRALAADVLLRRRGFAPELKIGIRPAIGGSVSPLEAHAWVECNGAVAIGALDDLATFERLATWSGQ